MPFSASQRDNTWEEEEVEAAEEVALPEKPGGSKVKKFVYQFNARGASSAGCGFEKGRGWEGIMSTTRWTWSIGMCMVGVGLMRHL